MPTIMDIAREAGVSCGTVSNVLNKKGNVRADKIRLVEEAVHRLGYSVNESAQTLRKKHKRSIVLLVPDMRSRHYISFYETISAYVRTFDYTVEIYSTSNLYRHEKDWLQKMVSANVNCIISFPTYINSADLYNSIPSSIFLVIVGPRPRGVVRPYMHVSFDYKQIANDITEYILHKSYRNVAVFVDSVRFSETFVLTIMQNLEKAGVGITIYGSTNRNAIVRAFDFSEQQQPFDAIVTSNILRASAVYRTFRIISPDKMPEIITLSSKNTIFEDDFTCVCLDYAKLGSLLAESMILALDSQKKIESSIILTTEGLNKRKPAFPVFSAARKLRVLASEGYCSETLQKLLPQFRRLSGIEVDLFFYPSSEAARMIADPSGSLADILLSDINYFRTLSSSVYLSKRAAPDVWNDLHGDIDSQDTYFPFVSSEHCCFSFNTACQMLFYRADLFAEQSVRRHFYEHYYKELDVPKGLRDYDEIAQHFNRASNPISPILYGASMSSIQAESFLEELFMQINAEGASITDSEGKPHFDSKAVLAAVQHHLQRLSSSNATNLKFVCTAIDEFIRGNSALSVFSTASAPVFNDNRYSAIADCVRCFDVPGKKPIVSSDIIGILQSCAAVDEAVSFMKWIFLDSISNILTLVSGQPICRSATMNTEILPLYPWLKHFNHSVESGILLSDAYTPYLFTTPMKGELITEITNGYSRPDMLGEALQRIQSLYERLAAADRGSV